MPYIANDNKNNRCMEWDKNPSFFSPQLGIQITIVRKKDCLDGKIQYVLRGIFHKFFARLCEALGVDNPLNHWGVEPITNISETIKNIEPTEDWIGKVGEKIRDYLRASPLIDPKNKQILQKVADLVEPLLHTKSPVQKLTDQVPAISIIPENCSDPSQPTEESSKTVNIPPDAENAAAKQEETRESSAITQTPQNSPLEPTHKPKEKVQPQTGYFSTVKKAVGLFALVMVSALKGGMQQQSLPHLPHKDYFDVCHSDPFMFPQSATGWPEFNKGLIEYSYKKHLEKRTDKKGLQALQKHLQQASNWFANSEIQGYVPAKIKLAEMLIQGEGGDRDLTLARTLYREAAEALQFDLTSCIDSGMDVSDWLKLGHNPHYASEQLENLATVLSKLYYEGIVESHHESVKYYEEAKKIVDWLVGEDGSACSRVNYFSLASTEIAIDVCFKAIRILKNGNTSDFERAKKLTEYALTTFKLEDVKKKNLQQSLGELLELSDDGESTISHAKKLYWEAGAKSHIRFLAIEEATKKIVQPNEPYSTEGREASSEKQLSPEGRALFLQFVKEKEDQAPKPRKRPLVYFSNILYHKSLIHSFCSSNQFAELSVEQQVLFMRQVGSTSLHTAIEALENPDLIEHLIRKSPQNLLARDFQQNTPIEIARQFHYKASDINRWIGLQNQYLGGFTKP